MKPLPQRKSPRLPGYDYSSTGAYFVTICTHQRLNLFGEVVDGVMCLSDAGQIVYDCWQSIPEHYLDVDLDAFVVMPNHTHGILFLQGENDQFKTLLGRVMNAYKGAITAQIHAQRLFDGIVWQDRYHDHVIRNEDSLNRIRHYVHNNPSLWSEDTFFSES